MLYLYAWRTIFVAVGATNLLLSFFPSYYPLNLDPVLYNLTYSKYCLLCYNGYRYPHFSLKAYKIVLSPAAPTSNLTGP